MSLFRTLTGNIWRKAGSIGVALFISLASAAQASTLTFQGQNAALFSTANPSDTSALMNSVPKLSAPVTIPSINPATLIEQSVMSQMSTAIYNHIFSKVSGGPAAGNYNLGGGNTIAYQQNADGTVTVTLTSSSTGTTTITVPMI